jgi:hypothetical protein
MSAATAAWLGGVAEGEAEIEIAVDDILGVVTEALVETGADETAEDETTDEEAGLLGTADEADELAEELPEGEAAELEAEPDETDNDPLWVGTLEVPDGTVTITDSEAESGTEPDEVKVTKVDVTEVVLGATVLDEPPTGVEDKEEVNECVEVATVVELTPAELVGVLEGVETGG